MRSRRRRAAEGVRFRGLKKAAEGQRRVALRRRHITSETDTTTFARAGARRPPLRRNRVAVRARDRSTASCRHARDRRSGAGVAGRCARDGNRGAQRRAARRPAAARAGRRKARILRAPAARCSSTCSATTRRSRRHGAVPRAHAADASRRLPIHLRDRLRQPAARYARARAPGRRHSARGCGSCRSIMRERGGFFRGGGPRRGPRSARWWARRGPTATGRDAALRQSDFMVVAPYNAQVRRLRDALRRRPRRRAVGTVDKFQGREAAVCSTRWRRRAPRTFRAASSSCSRATGSTSPFRARCASPSSSRARGFSIARPDDRSDAPDQCAVPVCRPRRDAGAVRTLRHSSHPAPPGPPPGPPARCDASARRARSASMIARCRPATTRSAWSTARCNRPARCSTSSSASRAATSGSAQVNGQSVPCFPRLPVDLLDSGWMKAPRG